MSRVLFFVLGILIFVNCTLGSIDVAIQYAKAQEQAGKYEEAFRAYESINRELLNTNIKLNISKCAIKLAELATKLEHKVEWMWKALVFDSLQFDPWLSLWEKHMNATRSNKLLAYAIIVPCFNCAETVERTMESIKESILYLLQRCSYIGCTLSEENQLLLVDDGSTDNSENVLQQYISANNNIFKNAQVAITFVKHDKNLGHGAARNTALKLATSAAIFFLDSDDVYFHDHLYLCLVTLSYSNIFWVQTLTATSDPVHKSWIMPLSNTLLFTKAIRKEAIEFLESIPDLGNRGGEDSIFYFGLISFFPDMILIPHNTTRYTRRAGNSFDVQFNKFLQPYSLSKEDTREFQAHYSEALRKWDKKKKTISYKEEL